MKEHDIYDKYGLKTDDNGDTFITYEDDITEVEAVVCDWLYKHGFKR